MAFVRSRHSVWRNLNLGAVLFLLVLLYIIVHLFICRLRLRLSLGRLSLRLFFVIVNDASLQLAQEGVREEVFHEYKALVDIEFSVSTVPIDLAIWLQQLFKYFTCELFLVLGLIWQRYFELLKLLLHVKVLNQVFRFSLESVIIDFID